jgi:hypothetical protein
MKVFGGFTICEYVLDYYNYCFRIASNKMSVRLDAQRFHYVELSNMIARHIGESTKSKLLEACVFCLFINCIKCLLSAN